MLALSLRNLLANRARLLLVTAAIAIGVSFVSATFIFSDSMSETFDDLSSDIVAGVDLEVRPTDEFGTAGALTSDLADRLASTPGVAEVGAFIESESVVPVAPSGELAGGFPVGLTWVEADALNPFEIVDGRAPNDGEFVMGQAAAERDGFVVGQSYDLSTPAGLVERVLSGTVRFGAADTFGGQVTFTLVPLADAQQLFGLPDGQVDAIQLVLTDTATAADVQERIAADLPPGAEVVSGRTIQDEQAASFNEQLSVLRNVLLGFAVVSVFVSTFIIHNTFGIILSQRIRELGLLRAIGADSRQIGRGVIIEAVLVGLIASVLGLLLGIALNAGLIALFNAIGASLPTIPTVISVRTIVIAIIVGVVATVGSAIGPARQATGVAPIAALNGHSDEGATSNRRVIVGAVVFAIGIMLGCLGLFVASSTALVLGLIAGALLGTFIGIALISPALAPPLIAALGAPVRRFGVAGDLASENARRNPRRTANTSTALVVGLALITTVLVVGQSVKAHLATTLDNTVSADFVISNNFEPMTSQVATALTNVPEIGDLMPVSDVSVDLDDTVRDAVAVPLATTERLFDLGISGEIPATAGPNAVVSTELADELGLSVGDTITAAFANGTAGEFSVVATYRDTTIIDDGLLLEREVVEQRTPLTTVDWVAARTANGVTVADADAALERFSADWPQVDVQTSTEYRQSVEEQIDGLLSIVNVLLALSIVIALIGIGLTLALSVFERTREIGLLRAVGMSRRQVRRMVRWEAALVALFGAVLGVGTGLIFGWGAVTALPENIATAVSLPAGRIAMLVIAAGIAGIVAALLPARRAGRLHVLDAITGRAG